MARATYQTDHPATAPETCYPPKNSAIMQVQTHSLPKIMTATEKPYQRIQALPDDPINEVLNFAELLHQKQRSLPRSISPGTLTGLRGIAKRPGSAPSDADFQAKYTDDFTQKYQ
jgi:hypothetical protein